MSPFDPQRVAYTTWSPPWWNRLTNRSTDDVVDELDQKTDDVEAAVVTAERPPTSDATTTVSPGSRLVATLLCALPFAFPPVFGLHRFYLGKWKTGLLWFFTFGLMYLGQLFDLAMLVVGVFRDSEERPVIGWLNPSTTEASDTPVNEYSSVPTYQKTEYWRPSGVSLLMSITAGVIATFAVFVGCVIPIFSTLVAHGVFDELHIVQSADIAAFFQMEDWDKLPYRVFGPMGILAGLISFALLLRARASAGFLHMLRVVVGSLGLYGACIATTAYVTQGMSWSKIDRHAASGEIGRMIVEILAPENIAFAVGMCLVLIVSLLILAWPAKRARAVGTSELHAVREGVK